jgi:murein DD-endopeptidase MepM/ murein hydrolase activator NlpD
MYRKTKSRRKRRSVRISLVDAPLLHRFGLYGAVALLIIGGFKLHSSLQIRAKVVDNPYRSLQVFAGQLGGGRLKEGLRDSGTSKDDINAVLRALRRTGGAGKVRRGDAFRIVRSTDGTLHHLTLLRGKEQIVLSPGAKGYQVKRTKVPMQDVLRTAHGRISSSLWVSMSKGGSPAEIIQEFADVFQWSVDFLTEPRKDDTFAVAWVERRSPDGRVWKRDIQAALYDGKRTKRHIGILFEGEYYDDEGNTLQRMFLRAPLNFRRISSYFSKGRWHPVLRKKRAHHGIDYAAPRGTPVVAVGRGKVTAVGRRGGFGKRIEIKHTSVYSTLYGHLNAYAKNIKAGKTVAQGQVIGYVGSTGLATGPHLHFQISKHGRWVNFLRLKLPRAKKIPVKNRDGFMAVRNLRMASLGFPAQTSGNGR